MREKDYLEEYADDIMQYQIFLENTPVPVLKRLCLIHFITELCLGTTDPKIYHKYGDTLWAVTKAVGMAPLQFANQNKF